MSSPIIGFISGTGNMGSGLARNHLAAGFTVLVGSRDINKAKETVEKIKETVKKGSIEAVSNEEVARRSDIVFWGPLGPLAEIHASLRSLAPLLKNKIVVDYSNAFYAFKPEQHGKTSSTELAMEALGEPAKWVHAYKCTASALLAEGGRGVTVVYGGDHEDANLVVRELIIKTGFVPLHFGDMKNERIFEQLLSVSLEVDRRNAGGKVRGFWAYNSVA